jgi:hypothetical protein
MNARGQACPQLGLGGAHPGATPRVLMVRGTSIGIRGAGGRDCQPSRSFFQPEEQFVEADPTAAGLERLRRGDLRVPVGEHPRGDVHPDPGVHEQACMR